MTISDVPKKVVNFVLNTSEKILKDTSSDPKRDPGKGARSSAFCGKLTLFLTLLSNFSAVSLFPLFEILKTSSVNIAIQEHLVKGEFRFW